MRDETTSIAAPEPIAVVGIGCRFPGGCHGWRAYWRLLAAGRSAIGPVPPDRWNVDRHFDPDPDAAAKVCVREGGFLTDPIDRFDAAAFGISPREAAAMDPQQRLLLEVAVEALEDAGIACSALAGSETGVYAGAFTLDYQALALRPENAHLAGPSTAAGMTLAAVANRLSHALDLRGPSVAFDTACSASLTALHYACRDLRDAACEAALCGGVNVMLLPEFVMALCRGRFVSPGGRSRAFDAAADGYARGEGAGVVVLKTLSRALADGDPVHALIRASGLNQDGRTDGLSRPSAAAQEALLRRVYAQAGISPSEVAYLEAHGTGTAVGDVTEAEALGAVFGPGRPAGAPLLIGTAKANIGHLEAAAGIAGLIKAILTLRHGEVSANPLLNRPNPAIDFLGLNLRVPTIAEPLPKGRRLAGVSGFGYGGANAHVVVEAAPEPPGVAAEEGGPALLLLSAPDEPGLKALARHHAAFLRDEDVRLADHCLAAAVARDPAPARLAVVASDRLAAAARLDACAEGEPGDGVHQGRAPDERCDPVLVFTGMGAQHRGMAAGLAAEEPAFRTGLEEVDAIFRARWSVSPARLLADTGGGGPLPADAAQWTNFALQVALCRLLDAWGAGCAAVIGHSAGEIAAAWRSGALALQDAAAVAFHRGRLTARLSGSGRMLATALSPVEAGEAIARSPGVEIAAVNAPSLVTLSGAADALATIAAELEARGRLARLLATDVPYHSRALDRVLPELAEALGDLAPSPPAVRWLSTVEPAAALPVADAAYWVRNARGPVRFAEAVAQVLDAGARLFLEVGPHPVLGAALAETAAAGGHRIRRLATLDRRRPPREALLGAMGGLFVAGAAADWRAAVHRRGRRVSSALPRPLWADTRFFTESATSAALRKAPRPHPLLGDRQTGPATTWQARLSARRPGFLSDHRVAGRAVFPASGFVATALAARRALSGDGPVVVQSLRFHRPLALSEDEETALGTVVADDGEAVSIHAASWPPDLGSAWTIHATMRAVPWPGLRRPRLDLAAARRAARSRVDPEVFYARLRAKGLDYGPAFRSLRRLLVGDGLAVGEVVAPDGGFSLDPRLLDGAFQTALALADEAAGLVLPEAADRIVLVAPPPAEIVAVARARARVGATLIVGIDLCAPDGGVVARVETLRCAVLPRASAPRDDLLYASRWTAAEDGVLGPSAEQAPWLLATEDDALAHLLAATSSGAFRRTGRGEVLQRLREGARRLVWDAGDGDGDPAALAQEALRIGVALGTEREGELVALTREAILAAVGDRAEGFGGTSVWGVLRSLGLDRPNLRIRLVDLPSRPGSGEAAALARLCAAAGGPAEAALRSGRVLAHRLGRASESEIVAESLRPARPDHGEHVALDLSGGAPLWRRDGRAGPAERDAGLDVLAVSPAPGFPGRFDALARRPGGDPEAPDLVALSGDDRLLASRIELPPGGVASARLSGRAARPPALTASLAAEAALAACDLGRGAAVVLILGDGPLAASVAALCAARGLRPHVVGRIPDGARIRRCAAAIHDPDRLATVGRLLRALEARGGGAVLTIDGIDLPLARFVRPAVPADRWRLLEPVVGALSDPALLAAAVVEPVAAPPTPRSGDLACGASGAPALITLAGRTHLAAPALRRPFSGPGAAVVTGGLSGFGSDIAAWLAANGAERIALLGRRGPDTPGHEALLSRLRAAGAEALALACDLRAEGAVASALDAARNAFGPIRTVVHAAGVVEAVAPEAATSADFARAFGAKVGGAVALDRLTREDPVGHFVMVGSLVGLLGNRAQAPYAAANAVLWGLADRRRAEGRPALTLAFGALGGDGAAGRDAAVAARFAALGLGPMDPRAALDACRPILDAPDINRVVVADADWSRLGPPAGSPAERLAQDGGRRAGPRDLAALAPAELALRTRAIVAAALAAVIGADAGAAAAAKRLGLDSLMATEVSLAIRDLSGLAIDPIDVLSARTADALAGRLVDVVARRQRSAPALQAPA